MERFVSYIPEPQVPPKPEKPSEVTASYLLPYFKWYVLKDPQKKSVSWEQIFDYDRPTDIVENVSYKSRRHIEIQEKVKKVADRRGRRRVTETVKDAYRVVAEAIVLEDEAQIGFNNADASPHLLFRLTLVSPGYKVDPRKEVDPEHMYARVFVDLGPEGAELLDYGDNGGLNYERKFYINGQENVVALQERVMSMQSENPILKFFTDPDVPRHLDEPAPSLSTDHLRLIYDTFLPTEPQDGQAA